MPPPPREPSDAGGPGEPAPPPLPLRALEAESDGSGGTPVAREALAPAPAPKAVPPTARGLDATSLGSGESCTASSPSGYARAAREDGSPPPPPAQPPPPADPSDLFGALCGAPAPAPAPAGEADASRRPPRSPPPLLQQQLQQPLGAPPAPAAGPPVTPTHSAVEPELISCPSAATSVLRPIRGGAGEGRAASSSGLRSGAPHPTRGGSLYSADGPMLSCRSGSAGLHPAADGLPQQRLTPRHPQQMQQPQTGRAQPRAGGPPPPPASQPLLPAVGAEQQQQQAVLAEAARSGVRIGGWLSDAIQSAAQAPADPAGPGAQRGETPAEPPCALGGVLTAGPSALMLV
eukprot:TRINITY_DN16398_c0_g1_i1.p2 TRINITY_DN16398_c0_g1~~TRINITY_DN16398_c0_g1_i1.p2  ORF type:complete len:398 (+),score=60.02 TRINITY_DN16398_c0_g1_i1:154-1194(+)